MSSCGSCGQCVPDGQPYCSMCYGDPDYGRDGYYRRFLEEQEEAHWRQEEERRRQEEMEREIEQQERAF